MNVASKELCERLYELSGWAGTDEQHHGEQYMDIRSGEFDERLVPAYDLGYLLRKLPHAAPNMRGTISYWLGLTAGHDSEWFAWYDGTTYQAYGETPEDAATKLAMALFEQGVLTK